MKYKFGDKVLCNWQGHTFEAVVIAHWVDSETQGQKSNWIEVVDNDGYKTDVGIDCVELIPDPDTERMKWLYENALSKISKEAVFGKDRQIQTTNDLREAIDDERYRRENPSCA